MLVGSRRIRSMMFCEEGMAQWYQYWNQVSKSGCAEFQTCHHTVTTPYRCDFSVRYPYPD